MKKHEEGYVMILVLVVMIVMGLVTASILTFSLRNLQNQQLSIERMADKYVAQGEIEKYFALSKAEENTTIVLNKVVPADDADPVKQVLLTATPSETKGNDEQGDYIEVDITAKYKSVTIDCRVKVYGSVSDEGPVLITNPVVTYTTYKVTYSNPEEVTGA